MVRVFDGLEGLSQEAARIFRERSIERCGDRGFFTVVLSGGSTPLTLFRLLASPPFSADIPWSGVHLFWGDERLVPRTHPQSNFRAAFDAFISRVDIPAENLHPMPVSSAPTYERGDLAAVYEREIREFFEVQGEGGGVPVFDLVFAGLGTDGHTLSIFPQSPELRETERLVVESTAPGSRQHRLTLTLPVLKSASCVVVLVSGADKAVALSGTLSGRPRPELFPAQAVGIAASGVVWLVDRDAAALLGEGVLKKG